MAQRPTINRKSHPLPSAANAAAAFAESCFSATNGRRPERPDVFLEAVWPTLTTAAAGNGLVFRHNVLASPRPPARCSLRVAMWEPSLRRDADCGSRLFPQ